MRFIAATKKPHSFQEITQILKLKGNEKVSARLATNFLLRFINNFNIEAKSMRAFIERTYNGIILRTFNTFDWEPLYLKKRLYIQQNLSKK